MLEGRDVRLRLRDREDLDFLFEFKNNISYYGEYEAIQPQISRTEAEREMKTHKIRALFVVYGCMHVCTFFFPLSGTLRATYMPKS